MVTERDAALRSFVTGSGTFWAWKIASRSLSSLSALYNVVTIRPLFLRERSASFYRYAQHIHNSNQVFLTSISHQPNRLAAFSLYLRCLAIASHPDDNSLYYVCTLLLPSYVFNLTFYHHSVYWMAGLAHDAAHFFKFLFILVLYTLAMTLWVCLFIYLFLSFLNTYGACVRTKKLFFN